MVLKTGKLANRRILHFALQSLLALFGKHIIGLLDYNSELSSAFKMLIVFDL